MKRNKTQNFLVIILFVGIAVWLGVQSWVLPIGFALIIAFLILTVRKPKTAILLILIVKPIIDAAWEYRIPIVGLNFLQITGVAFPVIVFLIIYSNKVQFRNYKAINLFGLFVGINFVSYFVSTVGKGDSIAGGIFLFAQYSSILFQFLNSFAAYLIIPYLFKSEQDQKQLFWGLILAGIFPAVTGLLQIGGFMSGRTLRTTGELIRMSGFYHDSVNLRMYSFQTLLVIYLYLTMYITPKDKFFAFQKMLCYALVPVSVLIAYKGYSKAALVILLSWILIYFIFQRKILTGTVFIILLGVLYASSDTIKDETERLLYKEIMYSEGTLPENLEYTMLGGRFVSWGSALDEFEKQDIASQLIGFNYSWASTVHNDFLRVLISNGIVGLGVYIILLLQFMLSLLSSYFFHKDALSLGAIMVFTAFIIDSTGLLPLLYPGYCWFVFGIMSLSLNRDAFRIEENKAAIDPNPIRNYLV